MHSRRIADDTPQTLVGISFPDIFRAQEFLTAATRLASQGSLKLADAVTVVKDASGKTTVRETVDPQPLPSAMSGAVWAGLFGLLLGGPVGWVAGVALGAGAGVVGAKIIDVGIPDEWVAWFRDAVQPGTATVALLVTELNRNALTDEAKRFAGGHLVYTNLDQTTMTRLREALDDTGPMDRAVTGGTPPPAADEAVPATGTEFAPPAPHDA